MGKLSITEKRFLDSQGISLHSLFDATGMKSRVYKDRMRASEKHFCFGGVPCKKEGHTLRSRSGACIQCFPAAIAMQLRHSAQGYIYVAHSRSTGFIKIGYTSVHPLSRQETLRSTSYGGARDWVVKRAAYLCQRAGEAENHIHRRLSAHQLTVSYHRYALQAEDARELFDCSLSAAYKAFNAVLKTPEFASLIVDA